MFNNINDVMMVNMKLAPLEGIDKLNIQGGYYSQYEASGYPGSEDAAYFLTGFLDAIGSGLEDGWNSWSDFVDNNL